MKNILLLFIVIFTIACSKQDKAIRPHKTIISGQIRNLDSTDNKVITIIYTDPVYGTRVAARLDETGIFHSASNMCFTQNMTIYYNNQFINILVSPSDSLFVDIDMNSYRKGNFEGITISGNSSNLDFNNHFAAFYDYISNDFNADIDESLPADEYLNQFQKILDESYQKIECYARENNIRSELVTWMKRDLIYVYANYMLDYSLDNSEQRLQVFTDPVFDIDNPENFVTMMFPYHLSSIRGTILRADSLFMSLAKAEDMEGICLRGVELLLRRPATLCRDFMLYDFLKKLFEDNPGLKSLVTKDSFTAQFFADELRLNQIAETKQYKDISVDGILYLDSGMQPSKIPETDFMKFLAERYPDKVLYIDVWATWCGPCIAELKRAKELKQLFSDKDVVFVYLCMGSEADKWIPAIDKYEVNGEHYFFDSDTSELFLSTYQLPGYPSYLLMTKKGDIVSTQAPRPSNVNKASEAIDAILLL